jgi:phosphoglycolate phosphatase
MKYSAIILDFDNVILESICAKAEAFRELFHEYPQYVDEIVQFHLDNRGMTRFDKIRHIFTHILRMPLDEENFRQLCNDFNRLAFVKVIDSPFVPGVREFLGNYYSKCALYIISATPDEEIRAIVSRIGIVDYFKGVFGSPTGKKEHLRHIIERHSYKPEEMLSIGDAREDYEGAHAVKCHFIGRVPPGDVNPFVGMPDIQAVIHDFNGIEAYL